MHNESITKNGFTVVKSVFDSDVTANAIRRVEAALADSDSAITGRSGNIAAARNILTELPEANGLWRHPRLQELLKSVLGNDYVCVRALYFDKHPENTWSLPWHKDMTIAVKDNSIESDDFSKPTTKSGVPHLEASTEILNNMLTLRIHLDDVTEENGPLEVVAGSHATGKQVTSGGESEFVFARAGDVLAMRPLISHKSSSSAPGTKMHRRILHFEFSGNPILPNGLQWYYRPRPDYRHSAQLT